jgi:hypothetical protein
MSPIDLQTPFFDGGIRSVYFFNGRLLSGEDLSQEKEANREGQRRLGRALGDGIAFGLEVSETVGVSTRQAPVVSVEAGLAVNRQGHTLGLTNRVDVSLVRPTGTGATTPVASIFKDCQPLQPGVYVAGTGVYVLVLSPAAGGEGRAPVSGLGNVTATCNTRDLVEGVQFRLIPLDLPLAEVNEQERLRNRVAYQCFGVAEAQVFLRNPFGPPLERYGLLDALRPNTLTDCDVPLATLHWTAADGIRFIDLWSVRRRITRPTTSARWHLLVGDRRLSEGEAMFQQFAEQIDSIRTHEINLDGIIATQRFDFLPPAGFLPLQGVGTSPGFAYEKFFDLQAYHPPVFIEGAYIEPIVRAALPYPPIDLHNNDPIRLYRGIDGQITRPFMLFTSAYVPSLGEARFDIVRWDYSNFT